MIGTAKEIIEWLFQRDKEKLYEIKEYKQKRSLNANNYAWKLLTELANVHRTSKEEMYLKMLKDYGQSEMVSVLAHINVSGYFKYYEEIGRATLQGKEFIHYRIYKGSSEYDTREMAIFIDGIVQEAKDNGIDILPLAEVERLKEMWRT